MPSTFTVVYDACVLYPAQLRDLLMHLAMTDLFRAKWSADIHEEWIAALLRERKDLRRDQLERTRSLMDSHVRDCLVEGYEHLISDLQLPDADDRHVLACAIRSGASLIVTENLRDFPVDDVAKYGVEAIAPDDFVADIFDLDPAIVMGAIKRHKQSLKNPAKTWNQYLDSLTTAKMQQTAALIVQYLPQVAPAGEFTMTEGWDRPLADSEAERIPPEQLKELSKDSSDMADIVRARAMQLMQPPPERYNRQYEQELSTLVKRVPALAEGADGAVQQMISGRLQSLLDGSSSNYYDLRYATIDSVSTLGDHAKSAIPKLEKVAASDQFGLVRQSAMLALERLHDPKLPELLPQMIQKEGDLAVAKTLRDAQFRVADEGETARLYADAPRDIVSFHDEIGDRYPELKKFDDKAQHEWIMKTFPSLDRENFMKELLKATNSQLYKTAPNAIQQVGDVLAAKQIDEFKTLLEVARGDVRIAQTQMARQYLSTIIASGGSTIDSGEEMVLIGEKAVLDSPYMPAQFIPAYYRKTTTDWTTQAALGLAATATAGNNGRDLTLRLISIALGSGVQGKARAALLDAWKTLNPDGQRIVPEALYHYVLRSGT